MDQNQSYGRKAPRLQPGPQPADPLTRELEEQMVELLPRLRSYSRRLTGDPVAADDLVQETLTRAIERMHLWRPGSDLRAWLATILHNQHVNSIRRMNRIGPPVAVEGNEPCFARPPEQLDRIRLHDLQDACAKLPEKQRETLVLVCVEGEDYDTAAERLGIPVGTVRSRLSRGRERLRRLTGEAFRNSSQASPA